MQALHGGKAQHDKIDAHTIAVLLRGGMVPHAYVYPAEMRAPRDLLRRRYHGGHRRAALLAPIPTPHSQYPLPELGKKVAYPAIREGVEDPFPAPSVRTTLAVAGSLIEHDATLLGAVELSLPRRATPHDVPTFSRLQSVPGLGQMRAVVLL